MKHFRKSMLFGILSFLLLLALTPNYAQAKTKTYTAKPWGTKYSVRSLSYCDTCGYNIGTLDLGNYNLICPVCDGGLNYLGVEDSYVHNVKYRHIDYTVTVKKGKTCIVKFPTSKKARAIVIKKYKGSKWYDWAYKVKGIRYVSKLSGDGEILATNQNKIKLNCRKTSKYMIQTTKDELVVLRVVVK